MQYAIITIVICLCFFFQPLQYNLFVKGALDKVIKSCSTCVSIEKRMEVCELCLCIFLFAWTRLSQPLNETWRPHTWLNYFFNQDDIWFNYFESIAMNLCHTRWNLTSAALLNLISFFFLNFNFCLIDQQLLHCYPSVPGTEKLLSVFSELAKVWTLFSFFHFYRTWYMYIYAKVPWTVLIVVRFLPLMFPLKSKLVTMLCIPCTGQIQNCIGKQETGRFTGCDPQISADDIWLLHWTGDWGRRRGGCMQ